MSEETVQGEVDVSPEAQETPKPSVNIDKMSVQELKAIAYDIIGLLEKNKADLRMVNEQIAKKT